MLDFPRWKILIIISACLFFMLLAIPSLLPVSVRSKLPESLQETVVNLGLDLQGGSHLLLELDFASYKKDQLNNLVDELRTIMREANMGYRGLLLSGDSVIFSLRGEGDAVSLIQNKNPDVDVVKEPDGSYQVRFNEAWEKTSRIRVLEQSLEIVNRRIDETGTKEPIIARQGDNRILVQVPGEADPTRVKALLGKTAKMTFHMLDESLSSDDIERGIGAAGVRILEGDKPESDGRRHKYPVLNKVELSGDLLVDAHPSYDQQTGEAVVAFRFNNAGARKFGEITAANVGKPFAIVLDNKVITAPVIRSPILGGSGIISGSFTTQSATDLALLLRAGALPAPLNVIEERSVGPSLGQDSIEAGTLASLIGVGLVIIFMLAFYGLFGLFANIAMIINALMVLSLLALFGATLTLPGIAGIVLTMGMAVDANVLIFERMREEANNGKSPFAAVESGFKLAFGTIVDSNITTFVAAMILFVMGSGTVKGFAVTLAIGIVCSMFTAILVTRMMVALWVLKKRPKVLPI